MSKYYFEDSSVKKTIWEKYKKRLIPAILMVVGALGGNVDRVTSFVYENFSFCSCNCDCEKDGEKNELH